MSIGGPSALGTLLVQRLDAVLGTTLSQQTNIASGARPDAVAQPDRPQRPGAAQNETLRHPRESVERASSQTEQQIRQAIDKTKIDASKALLSGRSAPATSSTASAPTTLGAAARTILALLASYPDQAPPIAGKAPLAFPGGAAAPTGSAAPATTTQTTTSSSTAGTPAGPAPAQTATTPTAAPALSSLIAQGLSQALQQSGLFYESHLNNLTFGKQSAATLMTEPQALLGRSPESAVNASNSRAPASNEPTSPAPTSRGAEASSSSPLSQTATPGPASPLAGLHPETHLLVRQQLEVLANQAIAWRGEAWPDAPLEWDVQRRQEAPDGSNSPEQDHWATRLKITLPHLGEVQARLSLVNQQVVMHLIAPEAAGILTENAEQLRTRFLASGLQLSQLSFSAQSPESPAGATDIEGEA